MTQAPIAHIVDGTVVATVRIEASPEVVFPYFTEAALLLQWIGESAELDARPNGLFALDFESDQVRGRYVIVDPPHRVVFTWGKVGDAHLPEGSSTVEVLLTAAGEDTIVELFHRGLPDDEQPKHLDGWRHFVLGVLPNVFPAR